VFNKVWAAAERELGKSSMKEAQNVGQTAELKHRVKIYITDTSYAAVERIYNN
jgi:hypothetical protein